MQTASQGIGSKLALVSMIAGLALAAGIAPANALKLQNFKLVHVNNAGPDMSTVRVEYDPDTDNWVAVKNDPIRFHFQYELTVKATYALAPGSKVSVHLDNQTKISPLMSGNANYSELHLADVHINTTAGKLDEIKTRAVNTCRTIRANGGKPSKEHRAVEKFRATASAFAQTVAPTFSEETASTSAQVKVLVVCEAGPHETPSAGGGLSGNAANFKLQSWDLFLTTYRGQTTSPNPGTKCQKLYVKVVIQANKSAPVSHILRRDTTPAYYYGTPTFRNSGPYKGLFVYEKTYVETFSKTTYVKYRLEVGNGRDTGWKDITVRCTGAGGGLKN